MESYFGFKDPVKYYMIIVNNNTTYYLRKNFQIIEGQLNKQWKRFNVYGLYYKIDGVFQNNVSVELYEHDCQECDEIKCRDYDISKGKLTKSLRINFEKIFMYNEYTENEYTFKLIIKDNYPICIKVFKENVVYANINIGFIYCPLMDINNTRHISDITFYEI
jgi:hypothetical protein